MKGCDFIVIDLVSQGLAVERHVQGWPKDEILGWLSQQGRLESDADLFGRTLYFFTSGADRRATFYLDDGQFLFMGDHRTFRPG
jgi:hypothetical protein